MRLKRIGNLDERAKCFGVLKGFDQRGDGSALHLKGGQVDGKFFRPQAFTLLQAQHIELGRLQVASIVRGDEQATVVGAGFHQQGKTGHLGSAVVNV